MLTDCHLEDLRITSLAALGQAAGHPLASRSLATLLAPALMDTRLPIPVVQVPASVPGMLLRQRADVLDAEADLALAGRYAAFDPLRLARYLQALSAPIEASPDGTPAVLPRGSSRPEDVLQHARDDIAHRLGVLGASAAAARRQQAVLEQLNVQHGRLQALHAAGRLPEAQLLAATRHLLVEEDRFAAVIGRLGQAWIGYQYATGGAGHASLGALLGGPSAEPLD